MVVLEACTLHRGPSAVMHQRGTGLEVTAGAGHTGGSPEVGRREASPLAQSSEE